MWGGRKKDREGGKTHARAVRAYVRAAKARQRQGKTERARERKRRKKKKEMNANQCSRDPIGESQPLQQR